MKPRVLVSEPIFEPALDKLRKTATVFVGKRGDYNDPARLAADLNGFDALLSMLSNPVNREVLQSNPSLKIVANYAVGYNNIDIATARTLGIKVANTPDVLTEATADLAIGLLLAVTRKIVESERFLRAGKFDGWDPMGFTGMALAGKTAGIIGMGRIGTAIAFRLRAFGMNIRYHNRKPIPAEFEQSFGARYHADSISLLKESDVVILSCPLTEKTRHLIDAVSLKQMKPRSIIINTARGPVIHEAELAEALHNGTIAGAGLDVFEYEPEIHPRLLSAPNTVLLPHIGSATVEARAAMAFLAVDAILDVLSNRPDSEIANLV